MSNIPDEWVERAVWYARVTGVTVGKGQARAVLAAALPDVRAHALREAAEAARGMHDPVAPDCAEWADWLDARAAREIGARE